MPRIVRGGLIQARLCEPATAPLHRVKKAMVDEHIALVANAVIEMECVPPRLARKFTTLP